MAGASRPSPATLLIHVLTIAIVLLPWPAEASPGICATTCPLELQVVISAPGAQHRAASPVGPQTMWEAAEGAVSKHYVGFKRECVEWSDMHAASWRYSAAHFLSYLAVLCTESMQG